MKYIKEYILEALKINSKSKVNNKIHFSKKVEESILDDLCYYFSVGQKFKGNYYNTRLDIVTKIFNSDICKFIDSANLWDDLNDFLNIDNLKIDENDLKYYIKDNNKQLYKEIKKFV